MHTGYSISKWTNSTIVAFFLFFKWRCFKGICEHTSFVRLGASQTEACWCLNTPDESGVMELCWMGGSYFSIQGVSWNSIPHKKQSSLSNSTWVEWQLISCWTNWIKKGNDPNPGCILQTFRTMNIIVRWEKWAQRDNCLPWGGGQCYDQGL